MSTACIYRELAPVPNALTVPRGTIIHSVSKKSAPETIFTGTGGAPPLEGKREALWLEG